MMMGRTNGVGPSMTGRMKAGIAVLAAAMAIYLGWFVYSPFALVWNGPLAAVAEMASASWLFWFALLIPVWAPVLVPARKVQFVRAAQTVCGTMLLLIAVIGFVWLVPETKTFGLFVVLGVLLTVGALYIRGARRAT